MNFNQLIKQPTRITQTTATLLDLIATNGPNISFSGVVGVSLGDHEVVLCVRKVNWRKLPAKTRIFRNCANCNHASFCSDLNKIEWEKALNPTADSNITVDGLWTNFKDIFLSVANDHAPLMEKRVRGKPNPWISGEIKTCIRERNYQLRKARRSNKSEDWATYRFLRNSVTKSIKRAKSNYNRKLIEENMHDSKGFWKTIKKIMPGESKGVSSSFEINGKICTDKKQIAAGFNSFFSETVGRLVQTIGTGASLLPRSPIKTINRDKTSQTFKFTEISADFVLMKLNNLKTNKASVKSK
jgi:hypothetical protein